jgi:DNA-binding Lrp family transcriptional regulator
MTRPTSRSGHRPLHADADAPRTEVVRDPERARLLLDARTRRQLAPFLGAAASVGEAARARNEKPNTVLRRVRRLLDAGLLEVVETVPRRGRPIRRYRAVAEVFFVPFEASAADDLESALAEREAWVERLLRRAVVRARREALGVWGTRIYADERGRGQVQMAVRPDADASTLDPGGPAVLSAWRDGLELDYPDAKALQRELYELLLRYQRKRGAQRYVVHLGLAPVAPDEAP